MKMSHAYAALCIIAASVITALSIFSVSFSKEIGITANVVLILYYAVTLGFIFKILSTGYQLAEDVYGWKVNGKRSVLITRLIFALLGISASAILFYLVWFIHLR